MKTPSRTVDFLALQVKDGDNLAWQIALVDLAILHDRLDPIGLEANIHFQPVGRAQ